MNVDSVGKVSLTFLVDNKANLIVEDSEQVKYFGDRPLLAEHGFSVLIQLDDSKKKILWDAGLSESALVENMERMGIDSKDISNIALSHGHDDHYGAMTTLLRKMRIRPKPKEWEEEITGEIIENWLAAHQLPIVLHPAALRERWWQKDNGGWNGPFLPPPVQEWEALGTKVITSDAPYRLAGGCWTTGYVPRKSFEKTGRPTKLYYRDGDDLIQDDLEEDQAIVFHVKDKGLVVLSGCAHAGIVNTVEHAREFTGIDRVYAVIGGFHLARSNDEEIRMTIDYLKQLQPALVVPTHCTGLEAISQIAREMGDVFIEGVVGATYII